jgi:hypothetical protein
MASKDEVEAFLRDFKTKLSIWDIIYRDDRGKNAQTLADLEIRPVDRTKIIESITAGDYCDGPVEEKLYKGAGMWVFGKEVKKNEVYIKITLGFMYFFSRCRVSYELSFKK